MQQTPHRKDKNQDLNQAPLICEKTTAMMLKRLFT